VTSIWSQVVLTEVVSELVASEQVGVLLECLGSEASIVLKLNSFLIKLCHCVFVVVVF
jgi:hypothetical protein